MSKYLITSALPYANGNIHIGHLVEYIQTDIFARYHRIAGDDVCYFCAVDAHGTPISLSASRQKIAPEAMVEKYRKEDYRDFCDFHIKFECFYTTHSLENKKYSELIYSRLKENGDIVKKEIEQMYCEKDVMFLPDRFVRGICPKCGAEDQYGDVCERCNSTYTTTELKNPRCFICGGKPVFKKTDHFFFKLSKYQDRLSDWIKSRVVIQNEVKNYVLGWLKEPLQDWDISRDAPYFGFEIPGEVQKYFYVWLDAPVGYIATADKYCNEKGISIDMLWCGRDRKIIHVIGKDIIYFHALFWPAMLLSAGFSLPHRIQVHGMLTVNGEKMSKSRGTFITARDYLDKLDPQYLRFYYASKLSTSPDDIDLNFDDFITRVNSDLVNNMANVVSRSVQFVEKKLDGVIGMIPEDTSPLREQILKKVEDVRNYYEQWAFGKATAEMCSIADIANKYFQDSAPWDVVKTDRERGSAICAFMINCAKIIAILIKPILPKFAADVESMLAVPEQNFGDAAFDLENHKIGKYRKLIDRLDRDKIDELIKTSKM